VSPVLANKKQLSSIVFEIFFLHAKPSSSIITSQLTWPLRKHRPRWAFFLLVVLLCLPQNRATPILDIGYPHIAEISVVTLVIMGRKNKKNSTLALTLDIPDSVLSEEALAPVWTQTFHSVHTGQ